MDKKLDIVIGNQETYLIINNLTRNVSNLLLLFKFLLLLKKKQNFSTLGDYKSKTHVFEEKSHS